MQANCELLYRVAVMATGKTGSLPHSSAVITLLAIPGCLIAKVNRQCWQTTILAVGLVLCSMLFRTLT
jgi:hypothetical protein